MWPQTVTGYSSRGFHNIRVELLGRFRGAHLKVPHLSMLTLACVVHAHWCFYGNSLKLGPVAPPEREGQRRAAFHRASTQTEKHTNQITPKQDYNACESSLFTHIFTLLCIKKRYVYFAVKYECIGLSAQQHHLDLVGQCPTCP